MVTLICAALRFILTMWYVKATKENLNVTLKNSFILTMWYVKISIYKTASDKITRFILTMWYVKPGNGGIIGHLNSFYINYVVCKEI